MISKRIKAISEMVSDNSYAIDVGCDHALLDIYLAKNKNCKMIASDINEKPLLQAKSNIKKNNLEKDIQILLADGISKMPKEVDTIILSGMGTDTIINILENDYDKLTNIKNIVISTQNHYYRLRKKMMLLGFSISKEDFIYDKGKYYLIISFAKKNTKYSVKELVYGPILINSNNKHYKDYLKKQIDKYNNIIKSLKFKNILLKFKYKKRIRDIKNIL